MKFESPCSGLVGFPGDASCEEPTYQCRLDIRDKGSIPESDPPDALEDAMATHSSILAWRIPWTEEPGGLQSRKLERVGHN